MNDEKRTPDDAKSTPEPAGPSNGQGPGAEAPATATTTLADELAEAQRQRDECLEQHLRTRAEFINIQKRARAQADIERLYAVGPLAIDLVAVLDNFERAADAARAAGVTSIVEGLDMVHKQLLAVLAKHGVEPLEALGQPFDPNQHEALMRQPSAEHPEGTVVAELGKGYKLRDRILRPAKVAVSVPPNG